MHATVSTKGWIVIPAGLREKHDLHPGPEVQVVDYGGVLAIVPSLHDPTEDAAEMLQGGAGHGAVPCCKIIAKKNEARDPVAAEPAMVHRSAGSGIKSARSRPVRGAGARRHQRPPDARDARGPRTQKSGRPPAEAAQARLGAPAPARQFDRSLSGRRRLAQFGNVFIDPVFHLLHETDR